MAAQQQMNLQQIGNVLLCQGCHTIMISPIFMCTTCDNNYCEDCKFSQPCKTCNTPIGDKQNLLLQELSHGSAYKCR